MLRAAAGRVAAAAVVVRASARRSNPTNAARRHSSSSAIVGHLVELAARRFRRACGSVMSSRNFRLLHHVAARIEQHAIGRQPVAAGAAGFLIVALDVFRQVGVDHAAHVRFVDAHAEGDGGADDAGLVAEEGVLVARRAPRRPARRDRPRAGMPSARSAAASASVVLRDWQ